MMRETKIRGRSLTIKCASPEEAAAIETGLKKEGVLATLASVGFSAGMSGEQKRLSDALAGQPQSE
jgi:hypothetical protein